MQTPALLVRNGWAGFEEGREGGWLWLESGMNIVLGLECEAYVLVGELCGEDGGSM